MVLLELPFATKNDTIYFTPYVRESPANAAISVTIDIYNVTSL